MYTVTYNQLYSLHSAVLGCTPNRATALAWARKYSRDERIGWCSVWCDNERYLGEMHVNTLDSVYLTGRQLTIERLAALDRHIT